jgi:hypothetical protein
MADGDKLEDWIAKPSGRVAIVIACFVATGLAATVYASNVPWSVSSQEFPIGLSVILAGPVFGPIYGLDYRQSPAIWLGLFGLLGLALVIRFLIRGNEATCIAMIVGVIIWFGSGIAAVHCILH